MNRYILLCSLFLYGLYAFGQSTVTKYEYWFDNSYSQKRVVPVTGASTLNLNTTISTENLNDGLHSVYIRFCDSYGHWSSPSSCLFHKKVNIVNSKKIAAYRYWVDKNIASAVYIDTPPAEIVLLNQSVTPYQGENSCTPNNYSFNPDPFLGFNVTYRNEHIFNIQFQDIADQWSSPCADTFLNCYTQHVNCDTLTSGLTRYKPYPTTDTLHFYMVTAKQGDSLIFSTNKEVIIDIIDPYGIKLMTVSASQSMYGYGFRAKLDGRYFAVIRGFKPPAISEYAITFTQIAKYSFISQNLKQVGNRGFSQMNLIGNGFNNATKVYLVKDADTITGTNRFFGNPGELFAQFDFTNVPLGFYNLNIDYQDTLIIAQKEVEIVAFKPLVLKVKINGPSSFRINSMTYYTITVENTGNATAYSVPLGLILASNEKGTIYSLDLKANPDYKVMPLAGLESLGDSADIIIRDYYKNTDDICRFLKMHDSVAGLYLLRNDIVINSIAPNSKYIYIIGIKAKGEIQIRASVTEQWKPYEITGKGGSEGSIELGIQQTCCVKDAITCVVKLVLMYPSVQKILEFIPIDQDCIVDFATEKFMLLMNLSCAGEPNAPLENKDENSNLSTTIINAILNCGEFPSPEIFKKLLEGLDFIGNLETIYDCGKVTYAMLTGKCSDIPTNDSLSPTPVTSLDPNHKYGYINSSGSSYFNDEPTKFTYVIEFENLSTATAPAQRVVVIDTLNKQLLKAGTFSPDYIRIGSRCSDRVTYTNDEYKWTIDLRPKLFLRSDVTLHYDSITGIARWELSTIDPTTGLPPVDPLVGFLPPNDTTGIGQGSVSFTIALVKGIDNGVVIPNRATIIFDENDPIKTQIWTNKKDKIAPASSMYRPAAISTSQLKLSWSGSDNTGGSGVWRYRLYGRSGEASYQLLIGETTNTEAVVPFVQNLKYDFYVLAQDSAGNWEAKTAIPDVSFVGNNIDNLTSEPLRVFPNPSSSTQGFELDVLKPNVNDGYQVKLMSMDGRLIYSNIFTKAKVVIKDIPPSAYLLEVVFNDGSKAVKKVIIN